MTGLRTARLALDPLGPNDFEALHALMSDWTVVRQLGSWPWPPDADFTRSRCGGLPEARGVVFAIRLDGRFLGTMGVVEGDLGYCLARSHWDRGIATEAGRAACAQAFGAMGLDRLTAGIWADNPASARVLAKLGFQEMGRSVEPSLARGVDTLSIRHALTRERWRGLHDHLG